MSDHTILGRENDIVAVTHCQVEKDPGDDVLLQRIRVRTRSGGEQTLRLTQAAARELADLLQGFAR